jgi:hypothetical protein
MKPVVLIETQQIELPLDVFYEALRRQIDSAQQLWPDRNCNWKNDPLALGILIYPPRVYEVIRRVKAEEQARLADGSSREQYPDQEGARAESPRPS